MKKIDKRKLLLKAVFIFSVNIFSLLSIVEFASFDIGFYRDSFERNSTEIVTGYDKDSLLYITGEVIAYLDGSRDNFDISVNDEAVFGKRETLHMVDVENIFRRGFLIRRVCLGLSIISGFALLLKYKKDFGRTLYQTSIAGLMTVSSLSLIIYLNFKVAFDIFHEILFTNDLWLLNPRTDTLIQMLPLDFFYRMSFRIVMIYVAVLSILFVAGISINILSAKQKKYE